MVLGVAHQEFLKLDLEELRNKNSVFYDVKGVLKGNVDGKL
jgi:UDP-N-acetyl-D-galactosamine dehydrogenase